MQIKYTHAFSLLEILLSLTLLSILSIVMLKPYTTQSLTIKTGKPTYTNLAARDKQTSLLRIFAKKASKSTNPNFTTTKCPDKHKSFFTHMAK